MDGCLLSILAGWVQFLVLLVTTSVILALPRVSYLRTIGWIPKVVQTLIVLSTCTVAFIINLDIL